MMETITNSEMEWDSNLEPWRCEAVVLFFPQMCSFWFLFHLTIEIFFFCSILEALSSLGALTSSGYVYATLANVVICLGAMFGIVLLLCTACTNIFQLSIQFCISMAVGSLTGDAVLHLLPVVSPSCHQGALLWVSVGSLRG